MKPMKRIAALLLAVLLCLPLMAQAEKYESAPAIFDIKYQTMERKEDDNRYFVSKESYAQRINIFNNIFITINLVNKNIDINKIGKKGFTTKGKGHGYGLSIVKDIAKHNDNIETFKDAEEQKFKQTILLYYTK